MQNFKLINNVTGWLVFLAGMVVYGLTVEPTASFWDCGEFIAVSYKLMVPHPPGAPLFLLIGRMFSMLAGGDVTKVAFYVNMVSVLSSALTSLFLFWSITLIAKRLIQKENNDLSIGQTLAIMGSGVIGAMAYTFSDSAWFSAVEAEVYAMSSFFTAFVVWAMLKWEAHADEPQGDRWLILIAYMMGLSIGVHLLNLVTIPALGYIYYFRRYTVSTRGLVLTGVVSMIILGLVQAGIITGLPSIANEFEILFVNSLGLPFYSGIIFFIVLFVGAIVYALNYTRKHGIVTANTAILGFAFIIIGYCSYGIIPIRSSFNPPIDENNPENAMSFLSYLKREQYGDRPLLYGPLYNAEPIATEKGAPVYIKGEKNYKLIEYKMQNKYADKDKTLLPRIYSPQPNHIEAYKRWVKLPPRDKKPSFAQNLQFMFRYQIGWMYVRYFMWNFAGRAGDAQDSNWLAPWEGKTGLPELMANNRARNQFYMLPFILGVIGLVFHYRKHVHGAAIVGLLFFFTGIAIVIYLNQPPVEPRERDYTFAGSFYAFSIWIGLGVLAIYEALRKFLSAEAPRAIAATLICAIVPGIMGAQGWDDHDRSDRYHSVDSAKNLLNSCAPNAILFTGGDNDTFPLWYVQEVEGFRTDVRVCNLSLLGTDWYIQQMKQKAYDSEPLPISLEYENFVQGKNDYIPFVENKRVGSGMDLKQYLQLLKNNHPVLSVNTMGGNSISSFPTRKFFINVDSANIVNQPWIPKIDKKNVVSKVELNYSKGAIYKNDLIVLDILATNNWERPIYFSTTLSNSSYMNLKEYFQLEGLAYRLMPVRNRGASEGVVNTPVMYDVMMNKTFWRNLDNPNVYYDENYKRFPLNSRKSFFMLSQQLLNESKADPGNEDLNYWLPSGKNKRDLALEVADYCFKIMPDTAIPYDVYTPQFISIFLEFGRDAQADAISSKMARRATEELEYFKKQGISGSMEVQTNVYILQQLFMAYKNAGRKDKANEYEKLFMNYLNFAQVGGGEDYGDYDEY